MLHLRDRGYSDNTTSEVAGKLLPAHPTARYKTFSHLWKKTRQLGGYVPKPVICIQPKEEIFPCCLSCQATDVETLTETLARRSANVGWLSADWWWDFGWTLPPDFVKLGIGLTPSRVLPELNRVFVFKPDITRGYLDLDLESHAQAGADQHEARIKVADVLPLVNYPGEIIAMRGGQIFIATLRTTLFGRGVQIYELYAFQAITMPYNLSILVDGSNFTKEGDKILLDGVELN